MADSGERDPASARGLCASSDLEEKGLAVAFEVLHLCQPERAFALRFEGEVVAYLNRCRHVPMEMDWQPGEFLDSRKEYILCSTHGAAYEPATGRCASGPCGRAALTPVAVEERDGQVCWYPSEQIRPVPGD